MKVGFIGLGVMGRPMALNLKSAGHEIVILERASLAAELRAAATVCGDAAMVAEQAEAVITVLPGRDEVEQVLFGQHGVVEGLRQGTLVVEMSSISPVAARDFGARIAAAGGAWLDAALCGGEHDARHASLAIMAGGASDSFARARPLLEAMGGARHVGEAPGAGQVCKIARQILAAINLQGIAEAIIFARKAGIDPASLQAALADGGAVAAREEHVARMLDHDFTPGFSIRQHQKDLDLALSAAREMGMALPATALVQQMFSATAASQAGSGVGADLDHTALVTVIEALASLTALSLSS